MDKSTPLRQPWKTSWPQNCPTSGPTAHACRKLSLASSGQGAVPYQNKTADGVPVLRLDTIDKFLSTIDQAQKTTTWYYNLAPFCLAWLKNKTQITISNVRRVEREMHM